MTIHQLFEILLNACPQPPRLQDEKFIEELKNLMTPLIAESSFERKQLILCAGQVAGYIYFLVKGFARGFYINTDTGKEVSDFLWNPHSVIAIPDSFFQQQPSSFFIEVMPQTQLMSISYAHLMECCEMFPEINLFSKNLVQQYNSYQADRNHDFAFLSAWQRYLKLLKMQPDIEQLVSKEVIASFLGIAPQSLSRMLRQKGHP